MERLDSIEPIWCEYIPKQKEHGKLYISKEFKTAVHLCACGCGIQSITPTGTDGWTLTENSGKVTLSPSIGNFTHEQPNYHAHYHIIDNKIHWS